MASPSPSSLLFNDKDQNQVSNHLSYLPSFVNEAYVMNARLCQHNVLKYCGMLAKIEKWNSSTYTLCIRKYDKC